MATGMYARKPSVAQMLQICGGAVGTDRLDGLTVKSLVEPTVVIVFTDGGTYDQRVVINKKGCIICATNYELHGQTNERHKSMISDGKFIKSEAPSNLRWRRRNGSP